MSPRRNRGAPLPAPRRYTSRLLADAMVIDGVRFRTYQAAVEAVFGRRGGILLAVIQYPNLVLTAIACEPGTAARVAGGGAAGSQPCLVAGRGPAPDWPGPTARA